MPSSSIPAGLTTSEAPFIENARTAHQLFIDQPYDLYSSANHEAWRALYSRMEPRWAKYGNRVFLDGLDALHLDHSRVPCLVEVNRFLAPLTGFEAKPVSGYVPAFVFFDCLRRRKFPTSITIRRGDHLDYLPEPDIFHDVAGHVPMHTDRRFADTLVRFGECAHTAAERAAAIQDPEERLHILASVMRAMARFFWFTIEFGLIRESGSIRAYGSGLMSSFGEIAHAVDSPNVQRSPFQLEWVIHQSFEIDHYQPLLFVVDSFQHLFDLVHRLEEWMKEGKLDHVAPGEPATSEADLKSFLTAGI
jgi:phenylalanine-4-hydroxylase